MRKPGPGLPPVDAEPLQTREEVVRERRTVPLVVVADEHPDAPRLAVAPHGEDGLPSAVCGLAQGPHDGLEVVGRPRAEEGQGEVQVLGRNDPRAAELPRLPGEEGLDRLLGEAERTEEP